jgi:uncharacterized membrane protein
MEYIDYVAGLFTFLSIYLFSIKHKYAIDIHLITCFLWMIYGYIDSQTGLLLTNVGLFLINVLNYKKYKKN